MRQSNTEPAPTDFIRSMKRLGFSRGEIYDTLTGAGLQGEEVELLMERVEINFQDMEFESKTSRLGSEVEEIFENRLNGTEIKMNSEFRILKRKLDSLESSIEGLLEQIIELQKICIEGEIEDGGGKRE